MKLAKITLSTGQPAVARLVSGTVTPLDLQGSPFRTLADLLEADNPRDAAASLPAAGPPLDPSQVTWRAPIDQQEVWAAGVTYKRSQKARMEESEAAASCYDRVYDAPRPELFFKATPHRVAHPGEALRIREDAKWNVPEPELTLVINSRMQLVGYTIGNDMSSRDIEGDNPLYLPQAKVYNQCCGLGPCIALPDEMPPANQIGIRLAIARGGAEVFSGSTDSGQLHRTFADLIGWLGRDNSFPNGVFLLTGTGIVPTSEFTLAAGDQVTISIDGIGTLKHSIVQGK